MADMTPIQQKNAAQKRKDLSKYFDAVNKKIGKNMIGFGDNPDVIEKLTIKYIPFPSLRLNAMCEGLPIGKFSIISGNPDSGKTSLILETIGKNMKKDPDFIAFWLESEGSLELTALRDMHGIDLERFIYLEISKNESAEKVLDILENAIEVGGINIAVINSLKCLTPKKEFNDSMEDQNIGLQARLNAKFMRKITHVIAEQETALVATQHRTTNIGQMHGDPMVLSGGQAIRYASMLTLDLRKKSIQDSDPIGREEGLKIGVHVEKNHCNQVKYPYVRGDYFVKFGEGTQVESEVIELAIESGILYKGGAWISEIDPSTGEARVLPNGDTAKWNGLNKTKAYLKENEDYYEYLKGLVMGEGIVLENISQEEIESIHAKEQSEADAAAKLEEILDSTEETKAKKKTTKKKDKEVAEA